VDSIASAARGGYFVDVARTAAAARRDRMRSRERPSRSGAAALLAFAMGCDAAPRTPSDDPRVRFRAAVVGAPGGAFLGVWGDARRRRAFVAGGFVGLDPARAPRGVAGRLLEYATPGRFVTRCTTDAALWWVSGLATEPTEVWAVGDRGRIVRLRGERCEVDSVGGAFEGGAPTLWGVLVRAPDDVWVVGGSPRPDGPRGVLLHGDGSTWRQEPLPARAARENLYKIAADGDALVVVGSGGVILRREAGEGTWREVDSPVPAQARIFTTHCDRGRCFAVGGEASGFVLAGDALAWRPWASPGENLDALPALNGVWARGPEDVYAVGVDGLVLHLGADGVHRPASSGTAATLHGVGGFGEVVLAVGGELDNASPAQRGVILVLDEDAADVTVDGVSYLFGGIQASRVGAGQ